MEQQTQLNIVELIERNPITRISEDCNERMIKKVKESFTDVQQQMFIASFYCYLNYDQIRDFVIDLDNVWEWMGFYKKDKAKQLLLKNFIEDKDYKILLLNHQQQKNNVNTTEKSKVLLPQQGEQKNEENSSDEEEKKDNRGGHNKQTVLMTIQTFKLFCLKAATKKACEVQEYYLKLENLIQEVLQEESVELRNKLQKQILDNEKVQKKASQTTHERILECYVKKNIVYLCELKEHNGKKIVKIGSSQNLKERLANIKNTYKCDPILLYVLQCRDHVKFERFLHKHETIRTLYINMDNLEDCDIKTRETYLVSQEQCDNLIKLIKDLYQEFTRDPQEQEDEEKNIEKQIKLQELKNEYETLVIRRMDLEERREQRLQLDEQRYEAEIERYEAVEAAATSASATETPIIVATPILTTPPPPQIRARANTRSPIVYKFNPSTASVVDRYDSIIDALRENPCTSASALKDAAKENTIYRDFRWVLSERGASTPPEMPPTVERKTYIIDFVAMIDIKREKIMDVFPSQREAAISRNLKGFTTISRAIKNQSISSGHYWALFANCSDEMKEEYLKTHTLPERHIRPNNTIIEQINPVTNEVVQKYNTLSEATQKNQMSRATLKKVSDKNEIYNGFRWRIITKTT